MVVQRDFQQAAKIL